MLPWLLCSLFYILGFLCTAWPAVEAFMPISLMLKAQTSNMQIKLLLDKSAGMGALGAGATFQVRQSILHLSSCFLQGSFQLQRAEAETFSCMHLECADVDAGLVPSGHIHHVNGPCSALWRASCVSDIPSNSSSRSPYLGCLKSKDKEESYSLSPLVITDKMAHPWNSTPRQD